MIKKLFWVFASLILFLVPFISPIPAKAEGEVNAHLFYGDGCPHCAKERDFLRELSQTYPQLNVVEYEIYYNGENSRLLKKVASNLGVEASGVPFLVIGDKAFVGFAEGITSEEIENKLVECLSSVCSDPVSVIISGQVVEEKPSPTPISENRAEVEEKTVNLPILGKIDVGKFSLPLLTFVLAFLDGFNPCAMWALIFLISLLLGMKDRRRMWMLGVAFIVSSAVVYFLFLSAWLNLFLFLGFVAWVRILVGLVALIAGGYYLRDYCKNKNGGCSVMGSEKRHRIFERLKAVTGKREFIFALGGIILLAVAVNMLELVCSAGLPAVYTQILSLSDLPTWQYYLYLVFYVFIFMLDDLFVFFTAMITLKATGVQSKYSRYSHLIGGFLMLLIGLLLLLKPEWLMFG